MTFVNLIVCFCLEGRLNLVIQPLVIYYINVDIKQENTFLIHE